VETYQWLPPEAVKIVLVLFLSFLIGLEREEHKAAAGYYAFGGVRTCPLIGLIGYSVALLSGAQLLPLTLGFLVVGSFLLLSYWHKLSTSDAAGVTSEMSGLATFLVGALVYYGHFWIATALSVASLLLLELKGVLEKLATRIPAEEIFTFAKFLLLTAVVLPILPNQEFGRFHINLFKTWLVVIAVSTISYGSYVLQKVTREHGGLVLAALLGGAYSSTVTTVVMSRRAAREEHPHLFAGGILIASGVMYVRLFALIALFNRRLVASLVPAFLILAAAAIAVGWFLFLAMLVATQLAVTYLGRTGVDTLAAIMGVTDVDPFIMGMTQAAGTVTPLKIAAAAVLIAAASNNFIKGIYAYVLADKKTGLQSLGLLAGLGVLGLVPLIWL
jgi:uncharacterized membrane protein (DUF4010 family)